MRVLLQTWFLFLMVTQVLCSQWFQQESGTDSQLNSAYFLDSLNGWVVGDDSTILHTSDGGINWIEQSCGFLGYAKNLNDVFFINDTIGWCVGGSESYNGIIINTSDGGNSWIIQSEGITRPLNAVFFINNSIGWIGGGAEYPGGKIVLKTTNGGIKWDTLLIDIGVPFSSIFDIQFIDDSIGWAVGGIYPGWAGEIFKTSDGGFTWDSQMGISTPFASCSFISNQVGWVTSAGLMSAGIFNTTNGGSSWELQYLPDTLTFESITSISIIGSLKGWAVGSKYQNPLESLILYTDNGGLTWNRQNVSTMIQLNSIFFIDEEKGWAVGDSGIILHTTTGGVTFIEENEIDELPTDCDITQNYPNPFNPSTKIRYSVPQLSNVTIKVFDIIGNEIETLINEEKPAGAYEITWYAKNLPSGVYFYQLKAGDFIQTKKMVLMK